MQAAFLFYTEPMRYTNEVIKYELMRIMGYSEEQAERIVESYQCNGDIDDLMALIESTATIL